MITSHQVALEKGQSNAASARTNRSQQANHRIGTAGFEPAISCSQGRRITRLSYIPSMRINHQVSSP